MVCVQSVLSLSIGKIGFGLNTLAIGERGRVYSGFPRNTWLLGGCPDNAGMWVRLHLWAFFPVQRPWLKLRQTSSVCLLLVDGWLAEGCMIPSEGTHLNPGGFGLLEQCAEVWSSWKQNLQRGMVLLCLSSLYSLVSV